MNIEQGNLYRSLDQTNGVIWEAGHYYLSKGPTAWTEAGWNVMNTLAQNGDARLLFLDDVHPLCDVSLHERSLCNIAFVPDPLPTYVVAESQMQDYSAPVLDALTALPKRKRARRVRSGWLCSGHQLITADGRPTCLMLDLGLTWYKRSLGYMSAVNIVPEFYEEQQRKLLRLAEKAMPDFDLRVVLHDKSGAWRALNP
ncbi:MAG: hypothetical protein WDZ93_01235 [Candidatus Paceibacterota bacterium]